MAVTEGPDGLYGELVDHAPRLARGIEGLNASTPPCWPAWTACTAGYTGRTRTIEQIRDWAGSCSHELWPHRQRGADLVYEAYATDIGGET